MVIVHPDEVTRLAVSRNRLGVTLVHCFVGVPKGRLEVAEALQVMKQRPDDLIGITVIKLVALCLAQAHRDDGVTDIARRLLERRPRNLTRDSRPPDPRSTTLTQNRLDGRDKTARGRRDRPQVLARDVESKWQSVGNDDEAIHLNKS